MRRISTWWTSASTLFITAGAALLLPRLYPITEPALGPVHVNLLVISVLTLLVWATQTWRVAIRGARGDVSISMAIDVATMLLYHPYIAAVGSAAGTALYHCFGYNKKSFPNEQTRYARAIVRGVVTFSAVALGGWIYRTLQPVAGPLNFASDWVAVGLAIGTRLGVRVIFYPLGTAALRPEPVSEQLRHEWNRLPLVPFLLTTTLGGLAALIWQVQPAAVVLLLGPLTATWAATREFGRLNELLATLEDKVMDRTQRLAETIQALRRRLNESEALNAVDQAMVQAIHPDEVLTVVARESARVTGGTSALVTLLSDDGRRQFVRAVHGPAMAPFLGTELPIDGSLTGLVVKSGQPHVSHNPEQDPRLSPEMVRAGSWKAVIEAPLRAKDQILGVLVVASSDPAQFDDQDITLLNHLAHQAGLMLENSRLHEQFKDVAILEERNRIARELHDSVTQVLFSLTLNLEAASGLMAKKPERAGALITRSQEMASEALAEMRSLIFELRPAALQEKGLAAALANHINLFRRRQGIEANLILEGEARLDPDTEFCLYRVTQEALNNVMKHAQAKQVTVSFLVTPEAVKLSVCDDGVGFSPEQQSHANSFGMTSMRERLAELGGQLSVRSEPGEGTCILATIPLRR